MSRSTTPKELTNNQRHQIINSYESGHLPKDIAVIMGINRTTVYKVIKTYQIENRIDKKLKGGQRRQSPSPEDKDMIKEWIDENCGITLKAIKTRLYDVKGKSVSEKTIDCTIKKFNYTVKRVDLLPIRRNDEESLDARAVYAQRYLTLLTEIDDSKIYFIDEAGYNVSMRVRRGRSLVGTRATMITPGLRSRNISVCCIMSKNGIYSFKPRTSAYNGDSFKTYVDEIILKLSNDGIEGACIILDNVPFHKRVDIRELVERAGHRLMFLPPYSPVLNPIENVFSKWKQNVRQGRPQNEPELFELINNCAVNVSSNDCSEFYRHMMGFMLPCLNKEPIIDE